MKKHILKLILISTVLFTACDGEFEKSDLAIFLKSPQDNTTCLEGTRDGSQVKIPFEWSLDGNPNNIQILIDELDSNKKVIEPTNQKVQIIENEQTKATIKLDYGKWYQWQIIGNEGTLESNTFSFYSEGEPQLNRAPFPAEIDIIENSQGVVRFTWKVTTDPDNDRLLYDAFSGLTTDTSTEIKTGMIEPENLTLPNPEIGSEYYIKIVSKEVYDDNSIGNSSSALIKVIVKN